jgi:hypothetical protein
VGVEAVAARIAGDDFGQVSGPEVEVEMRAEGRLQL